ncbi:MAG: hypothetical protein ACI8VT_003357, partial [Saprospiraceae bacterium]
MIDRGQGSMAVARKIQPIKGDRFTCEVVIGY